MFGLFALSIALAHPSVSPALATSLIETNPTAAVRMLNPLPVAEEMADEYVSKIGEAQKLAHKEGWKVDVEIFQGVKHRDTRVDQQEILANSADPNVWATTLTISFLEDDKVFNRIEVIFGFARVGKTWHLVQLIPIRADTVGSFLKPEATKQRCFGLGVTVEANRKH